MLGSSALLLSPERLGARQAANGPPNFDLQIVVDFYDDLIPSHFTRKTFQNMMRTFREWGIKRVYWNGLSYASGLYDLVDSPGAPIGTNAFRTYQEVGEFIPAAVEHAHKEGLELFIEFKPFDQYFPELVPHGATNFRTPSRKGIPALGGAWQFGTLFPEQHPEYLLARNMTGIREGIEKEPVGTIKFVKNDDHPTGLTKANLEIYVSSDNLHYQKYTGDYTYSDTVEERLEVIKGVNLNHAGTGNEHVRVISITGLNIREPYFAISTLTKAGAPEFANNYYKLVELYTPANEPMPFTYGIPRAETDDWYARALANGRFPDHGFVFDLAGNLANNFSYSLIDRAGYLDSDRRLLGLAKGKNPYMTALCPAYAAVRSHWRSQVEEFIHCGVDGVEFRWASHQDSLDLDAYGYNLPVVEEYKRRYVVDIREQEFDRGRWRELLGEYYTLFYQQAKALLQKSGKRMMVDVMPQNDSDPNNPQFLNVYLDWERWFSFADAVSFKWVEPNTKQDKMFRKVADRCELPTYYNVWPQVEFKGLDEKKIISRLETLQAVGHKGFMLYESASFLKARPDGTFEVIYPEIPNVIVPWAKDVNT